MRTTLKLILILKLGSLRAKQHKFLAQTTQRLVVLGRKVATINIIQQKKTNANVVP